MADRFKVLRKCADVQDLSRTFLIFFETTKESFPMRQTCILPEDLEMDIRRAYMEAHKTTRGAIQDVLLRGAHLALAELQAGSDFVLQNNVQKSTSEPYTKDKVSDNLTGTWAKRVKSVLDSGQKDAITTLDYVLKACEVLVEAANAAPGLPNNQVAPVGVPTEELVHRAGEHTDRLRQARRGDAPGIAAPEDPAAPRIRHKRGA